MSVFFETDKSAKFTISLPSSIVEVLDELVEEKHSNRSAVVASLLRDVALKRLEAEMQAGYEAMYDFAKELAEEDFQATSETWPDY